MKNIKICFLIIVLLFGLTGCKEKANIEDITLALLIGIDINDQGEVEVYMSSPVFSPEAKEKNEHSKVKTLSLVEARDYFDASVNGVTSAGKVQTLLIGKKVIEHKNWYSILDSFYRNAKMRLNADIAFVDGPVADIIEFSPKDKPRLSIFVNQLLETANIRNISIRTSLRKYYQLKLGKGITPYAPELSLKEEEIEITGTTLLNDQNLYKRTLSINDTQLLILLQGRLSGPLALTLPLLQNKKDVDIFTEDQVSFSFKDIKRKVHKKYKDGRYQFDIDLDLPITISESPIKKLTDNNQDKLKGEIEQKLQKDLNRLMKSFQKDKVDPIGLGIYAASFKYAEWKKIEDDWIKAYEQAKINVNVKVKITDKGINM